jgi:hypothetical protein
MTGCYDEEEGTSRGCDNSDEEEDASCNTQGMFDTTNSSHESTTLVAHHDFVDQRVRRLMHRVPQSSYQAMVRRMGHGFIGAVFERLVCLIVQEAEELPTTTDMSRLAEAVVHELLPPHLLTVGSVRFTQDRLVELRSSIVSALGGQVTKFEEGWV